MPLVWGCRVSERRSALGLGKCSRFFVDSRHHRDEARSSVTTPCSRCFPAGCARAASGGGGCGREQVGPGSGQRFRVWPRGRQRVRPPADCGELCGVVAPKARPRPDACSRGWNRRPSLAETPTLSRSGLVAVRIRGLNGTFRAQSVRRFFVSRVRQARARCYPVGCLA